MAPTKLPWLLLTAVVGLLALVGAACSPGSGVTVVTELEPDQPTDEPTNEPTPVADLGTLCEVARAAEQAFADFEIEFDGDLGPVRDRLRETFDELIAAAPADLREDLTVVRDVTGELLDVVADFDLSDPDLDLDAFAEIEARFENAQSAVDRVERFFRDECGIDAGLSVDPVDPPLDFVEPERPEDDPEDDGAAFPDVEGTGDSALGGGVESLPQTFGDDDILDELWLTCADGDLDACDDLYLQSPFDSEYERFGSTCADRADETFGGCVGALGEGNEQDFDQTVDGPTAFGDDPGYDVLWVGCDDGVYDACDDLYLTAPANSGYEAFGSTCGGRVDDQFGGCATEFQADEGLDFQALSFGDDPGHDLLQVACQDGTMAACDRLFFSSGFDSEYELVGQTCGGRREPEFGGDCTESF